MFAIVFTTVTITTVSDLNRSCIYPCTDSSAQHGETKVSWSSTPSSSDAITSGKNNAAKVSADEASGNSSKVHELY